ncbi:stability/partitioning determinant [Falsigemmobacter faecalis]|uniref:Stability/partitioning determinant n=1 Tax=Falsigemmobacter faecalis TaxID=2488730 RepID=A0A3P3DAM4_9RHOB|nr:stability/partitioning determinant [Falsigemmobacter faecalis]RRH69438.1 stability/partitioning determinant [Falsigemmobacter faecalis]
MSTRAKIGFGDALGDLSGFAPLPRVKTAAPPAEAAAVAGFTSREVPAPPQKPQQRRHRTGRSAQINIKAKPETIAALNAWADAQGLSIAEVFETMVENLKDS